MSVRFVSYLRVSTDRQGASGLGLEAQREAVARHVAATGGHIVREFVEIESGRRADRPKLAEALVACRLHGATLVIAKLDRLARNVAFISSLMDAGTEFVACDFPQANRLTVHILAAVAEHERTMISERTKAALAAAKARGVRLGNPANLANRHEGGAKGRATRTAKADRFARQIRIEIEEARATGCTGLRQIARYLNGKNIPTAAGGTWSAVQVGRVLTRPVERAQPRVPG
jgi:DNA invertase Pin-like site-specific DNA recombinase